MPSASLAHFVINGLDKAKVFSSGEQLTGRLRRRSLFPPWSIYLAQGVVNELAPNTSSLVNSHGPRCLP
ncbi:MAG: hypothetical protein HQK57_11030 [Deltaproteobacteria bacterium]|nr:hypothetical protein [Deltaproteobacteria bacterium]